MAPKKTVKSTKKEEANPEPPKPSTLPDGERSTWIGGWSAIKSLTALQQLTSQVRTDATGNPADATARSIGDGSSAASPGSAPAAVAVRVAPGTIIESDIDAAEPVTIVCGSVTVTGQLPEATAANRGAWEARRKPRAPAGDGEGNGDDAEAAGDEEEDPQQQPAGDDDEVGEDAAGDEAAAGGAPTKRPPPLMAQRSVVVRGHLVLQGAKPSIEIKSISDGGGAGSTKKANAGGASASSGGKGKGKKGEDEAARTREAEAQREREEAARAAAEAEAARLAQFAAPSKFPHIVFANIAFEGSLEVRGAHVTFRDCHFLGCGSQQQQQQQQQHHHNNNIHRHQVAVHQYCKVFFERCTFGAIVRAAVYCYPLSEVVIDGCAFSGLPHPTHASEEAPEEAAVAATQTPSSTSVALFCDNGSVTMRKSVIEHVTTGVALHGQCATPTPSHLINNFLTHILSIGIYAEGTTATIRSNRVEPCGYYGMQFRGRCSGKVLANSVDSTVRICRGASPFLHSNTLAMKLLDENDAGTIALQPQY